MELQLYHVGRLLAIAGLGCQLYFSSLLLIPGCTAVQTSLLWCALIRKSHLRQACQVSRIARVTHAIGSFHTLTRKPGLLSRIFVQPGTGIWPAVSVQA